MSENQSNNVATKNDQEKPTVAFFPYAAEKPIAQAVWRILQDNTANGNQFIYGDLHRDLMLNAARVHVQKFLNGVDVDDNEIPHLAYAAAYLMITIEEDYALTKSIVPAYREKFARMGNYEYDVNYPMLDLIPHYAYWLVSEVFTFGARKYGGFNYKSGFGLVRLLSAPIRHLLQFAFESKIDVESGKDHRAHAICGFAMALDTLELGTAKDDRFNPATLKKV